MELLNRSIRAFKGISDDPKLPAYQKDSLNASNESDENDQNKQSSSQKGQSEIMENAGEDIVIEFGQDDRNQPPLSPQDAVQPEVVEEVDEDPGYSDFEYRKTMESIIQIVLYSVLKWSTVSGFICIILTITLKWHLPCLYILLFICLVEMYSLLNTVQNLRKADLEEKHRHRVKVLQAALSAAAKASLIFYKYIKPFPLIYAFTPTLTFDVIFAIFLVIKYYRRPARGFYILRLLLTVFYAVLVASVALKIEGLIQWHWREVFMSYWALLGITVGMTIVTLLVFLNKFLSFFLVDRHNYEFYGILWLGLFFSGSSTFSCLFIYKLQKVLENELHSKSLLPFIILLGIYCIGFTMFTTSNFKKLEIFFTKFYVIDEEFPAVASPMSQSEDKQKPPSPKKLVIPRFLTKSSNTYFRKVTQNDIEKNKQRMQKLKAKNSKFKVKVKQPRQRQNSFDQATGKNTWIRNFAMNQIPDLLTIPETDRDKLRTEVLMTGRSTRREDIKPLNLSKKTSEGAFTSQPTDRSRAGLIGSHRSTVNYAEYTNADETTGTLASSRRRDAEKIDSYRNLQEGVLGHLTPENNTKITEHDDEEKADDGFSLFLEDIRPLSARRANSLNALPGPIQSGLPLITESASNKENSRLDASELMTSTLDASGVQQCLICFDKQPDAVFMDCGHGGVCYECSLEIWKTTMECYLCRKKINQVLQIDPKNKIGKHIIKVVSATQMVMCDNQNANSSASASAQQV